MSTSISAQTSTPARPRVLFISSAPLQSQLTGPAIRCLELAQQVSRVADVTVTAHRSIERNTPGLLQQAFKTEKDLLDLVQAHDAYIVQGSITLYYPKLLLTDRVKIFDLYDPLNLETLEHGRHALPDRRLREFHNVQATLHGQLVVGDFFLCANERQRDYYLGMLAGAGRVNPVSYDVAERNMRHLLAVVPVGLSAERPVHTRSVLRGVHPAVSANDFVLIWGGSLLDWLDPYTLIRAMSIVPASRPDVKLFFMASQHPTLSGLHSVAEQAVTLSRELGLLDQTVIFNHEWVPYDERANYLLEADLGVTTHLDHLETRFSLRTRVLDYLWAGLPLISSTGDAFGDLIQQHQLGLIVPPGDVEALARAILRLADDGKLRQTCRENVQRIAAAFQWEQVARPLVEFCCAPHPAFDCEFNRTMDASQSPRLAAASTAQELSRVRAEIRRRRRAPPARIVARLKTAMKRILRRRYTNVLFDRTIEAEGALLPGQRRGQVFQAYASGLDGVDVLIGTFGRINTCELVLHLCDSPRATTDLAVSRVNAMLLQDNEFHAFAFPPVVDSAGHEFYFWLESPDALLSDSVTLFHYVENDELVFAQHYR